MKELWQQRWLRLGAVSLVLVALSSGWSWWQARPDGKLHIIAPALAGDCLIVVTPHGHTLVIDGCSDGVELPSRFAQIMPYWRRSIDVLVITRGDALRLPGALALARHYHVGTALLPQFDIDDPTAQSLYSALLVGQTRLLDTLSDTSLTIDDVRLTVVLPPDDHGGAVLMLEYAGLRALLAPSVDDQQSRQLLAAPSTAQLLYWPWQRADDRRVAEAVGAQVVIYGEGAADRRQPRSLLQRGSDDRRLLHEDIHGTIKLISDGRALEVYTEDRNHDGR